MEENGKIITWDEYFMELAKLSARRSKDPKTKVGACIVNPETKRIISIGYNGLPKGIDDTIEIWCTDIKHAYVVHAEANAILNANTSLEGASIYVTMFPCNECAKLIVQKGITEVIFLDDKFLYKPQGEITKKIFEAAGVSVRRFK